LNNQDSAHGRLHIKIPVESPVLFFKEQKNLEASPP
jgi:hypothetical protein